MSEIHKNNCLILLKIPQNVNNNKNAWNNIKKPYIQNFNNKI